MFQKLPYLGSGVGLRREHKDLFLQSPPRSISWVEVISENYLELTDGSPKKIAVEYLQKIRSHYPIALHGVTLSIGSTNPVRKDYLQRLQHLAEQIEPAWISDHLCFSQVHGVHLHDLFPLPYTEEAIQVTTENILRTQDFLKRQILIENVSSYITYKSSEMTEWEFLSEVSRRADCGILLDINNIFVSGFNHGFDPLEYLRAIPLERVGQIHLAGHEMEDGILIDTHGAPVREEVWSLYKTFLEMAGPRNSMIERDDNIPAWTELEKEILRMNSYLNLDRKINFEALHVSP